MCWCVMTVCNITFASVSGWKSSVLVPSPKTDMMLLYDEQNKMLAPSHMQALLLFSGQCGVLVPTQIQALLLPSELWKVLVP